MNRTSSATGLRDMYRALFDAFGPQYWWPADSPTEVVIGAILTQNTAWSNVERAIAAMKVAGCIDLRRIADLESDELAEVIRPAGTYRVKARRLKAFADWLLREHNGDLTQALAGELAATRSRLLGISGIGPETADAVLLYAGGRPTFVVDAYTRRVLRRHHFIDERASYNDVKSLFERAIEPNVPIYNEFHALLVELAKRHCRTTACCSGCPLRRFPHDESL